MFRDTEYGERQEAFRTRLADCGLTIATVTSPGELEAALLQALIYLPRPQTRPREPNASARMVGAAAAGRRGGATRA